MYIDGSAACMHNTARVIFVFICIQRETKQKMQRGAGKERLCRQAGAWRTWAAKPSAWRVRVAGDGVIDGQIDGCIVPSVRVVGEDDGNLD
jgi:hypothetical protein